MAKYLDTAGVTTLWSKIKNNLVPTNGKDGQVLTRVNGKGEWADIDVIDLLSYGVEWGDNVADPVLTRVGNMTYHKTLPIQSGMRGCVYNPKTKKVVYWLDSDDWFFRDETNINLRISSVPVLNDEFPELNGADEQWFVVQVPESATVGQYIEIEYRMFPDDPYDHHTVTVRGIISELRDTTVQGEAAKAAFVKNLPGKYDIITPNIPAGGLYCDIHLGSNLSGYDGEVMVYVPEFWIKSGYKSGKWWVRISPTKIDETWEYQPATFVSAYKDTILNTVPENMGYLSTLEVNSAISVVNSSDYCRGGNNDPTNDADIFRGQLGKCRTSIPRATFRTYVRQTGKEIMSYRQYKNIMYWLYVIEYANFNSQASFNSALTSEGFHQGGLGAGLTNVSNWKDYNKYYPITPNGYTNEFGNRTNIKLIEDATLLPANSVYATRWRGIENPFGDTWTNVDGIIIDADADNHPNNMNYVYTTDDPTKYGDTLANIADMVLSGLEIHQDGYTKEWNLGSTAEIIPKLMGGDSTQYKCDYHWTGEKSTTLRTLSLGGDAYGTDAGLGGFVSNSGVASSGASVGFRSVLVV